MKIHDREKSGQTWADVEIGQVCKWGSCVLLRVAESKYLTASETEERFNAVDIGSALRVDRHRRNFINDEVPVTIYPFAALYLQG